MDEQNAIYADLSFPAGREDRPYAYIDMVATIDGKIVSGDRNESVADLGSKLDHKLMRRLEESADAVMIGAQTLRSTSRAWNPRTPKRVVVSRSGDLPYDSAFFDGEAYVATVEPAEFAPPSPIRLLKAGEGAVDLEQLLGRLPELGIGRLLVLGGSELNGALLHADLIDELFLTIAPKVKLGRDLPTYAGGVPLPRDHILNFALIEHHVYENEVFLRYRRGRET